MEMLCIKLSQVCELEGGDFLREVQVDHQTVGGPHVLVGTSVPSWRRCTGGRGPREERHTELSIYARHMQLASSQQGCTTHAGRAGSRCADR